MFGSGGMEVFLNLVWLAIGLVAFASLGAQIAAEPDRRRRARLIGIGSLALLCVIVLLFPIISVTDDLHSANVSAEDETSIARRADAPHVSPVIFTASIALPQRSAACESVEVPDVVIATTLLDASTNPRSPPFVTA